MVPEVDVRVSPSIVFDSMSVLALRFFLNPVNGIEHPVPELKNIYIRKKEDFHLLSESIKERRKDRRCQEWDRVT